MKTFSKDDAEALFRLAGFEVFTSWELVNQYWPTSEAPWPTGSWWLVQTDIGLIRVGWRKRVLEIDWTNTGFDADVTTDKVTKEPRIVHAWSNAKAVEYLTELRTLAFAAAKELAKELEDVRLLTRQGRV